MAGLSASTSILTPTTLMLSPASIPNYYPSHPPGHNYYALPPPVPTVERVERVCKNYVVHEVPPPIHTQETQGQKEKQGEKERQGQGQKPGWEETMGALFGAEVRWGEMKVWSGKGRPLGALRFLALPFS